MPQPSAMLNLRSVCLREGEIALETQGGGGRVTNICAGDKVLVLGGGRENRISAKKRE